MADRMSFAQQFMVALHGLSMADLDANPTGQPVAIVTIRTADGQLVGELDLGQHAVEATINAANQARKGVTV